MTERAIVRTEGRFEILDLKGLEKWQREKHQVLQ